MALYAVSQSLVMDLSLKYVFYSVFNAEMKRDAYIYLPSWMMLSMQLL